MFSTSVICMRNSTSSTTSPATQKPIAAARCLSQAAPSPQAKRRKGKLIMAPASARLSLRQRSPSRQIANSRTNHRHRKVLKFHALTSLNNGATSPLRSSQMSEAAKYGGLEGMLVAAHAASSVRLAGHAPAPPWRTAETRSPHQPGGNTRPSRPVNSSWQRSADATAPEDNVVASALHAKLPATITAAVSLGQSRVYASWPPKFMGFPHVLGRVDFHDRHVDEASSRCGR